MAGSHNEPCQDISVAGKGAGLTGERSGLWFEYRRIIEEVAPRWVVIENVPALRSRGLDVVLGGLAALGYDAEWHCIPAAAVGAPHRRDRVWIVAHAQHAGRHAGWLLGHGGVAPPLGERSPGAACGPSEDVANANPGQRQRQDEGLRAGRHAAGIGGEDVANADSHSGPPGALHSGQGARGRDAGGGGVGADVAHPEHGGRCGRDAGRPLIGSGAIVSPGWWSVEPDVGRVAHGVPSRVDRLRSLGNAVVPVIPYILGQAIMKAEGRA